MSLRHLGTILELLENGESPAECRPALVEILEGDDAELKLRALDFTPDLVDGDSLAIRHLELVEDADEPRDVRVRAAVALGPVLEECESGWEDSWRESPLSPQGYRLVQRRLERVYRRAEAPEAVRRAVLESSARAPEPWHRGAVRAGWRSEDPAWRRTAVRAMGQIGGFEETLAEAMEADDERVVATALRAMAESGSEPAAVEALVGFACDDETPCECRLAAIEGLRFVDSSEARRVLARLTDCSEDLVAGTAAWALDEWYIRHGSE